MRLRHAVYIALLLLLSGQTNAQSPQDNLATLAQNLSWLAWSPDGDVLYASLDDGLYTVDIITGVTEQIYYAERMGFFTIALDGRIAFFDGEIASSVYYDAALTILPADPADPPLVTPRVPMADVGTRLRWSPNGTLLAGTTLHGQVYDATTGELLIQIPPIIDERRGPGFLDVDWLDNDRFVLLTLDRQAYVYRVPQQDYIHQVPLPNSTNAALPLSPEHDQMLLLGQDTVSNMDTSTWQVIATAKVPPSLDNAQRTYMRWLPSGRGVVLTRLANEIIVVCSFDIPDCAVAWQSDDLITIAPALHPDGHLLAYAVGRDIYLLDLSDALAELGLAVAY